VLKFQNFCYHGDNASVIGKINVNDTVELHNRENPFLMQDFWP